MRASSAYGALAKSAEISAKHPAFSRLPFGVWCGVLIGQANRGEVAFARAGSKVVGMAGWCRIDPKDGERWLRDGRETPHNPKGTGAIINIVQADDAEVLKYMIGQLPDYMPGVKTLYGRRFYGDGRIRPFRMSAARLVDLSPATLGALLP
ncbi:MAG: hypothetical protein AAFQ69_08150 [Pseudomonadota bacterium]